MNDSPKEPPAETPIQRALRMKKAAQSAKPKAPGRDGFERPQTAGVNAGASKPWLKK